MSVIEGLGTKQEVAASEKAKPQLEWFRSARYGLFLHWGLYSILGRGEWVRNRERIPDQEYEALAARFDVPAYDPLAWARLARQVGMRYAVLTTKHHDGFCMWDSKACSFNSRNAACRRDLVGEFVEAFRSYDLKVGLYYSLGDWHNPDWAAAVHGDEGARIRFVDYTRSLLNELLSSYGPIDILWYDLPQGLTAEGWDAVSLNTMARRLQPDMLINNRSMLPEDFSVVEQRIGGVRPGRMWESCLTLNESWAYVDSDLDYKTPRQVAKALAKVAAGGGNLLLNVGPTGSGEITASSMRTLREVGAWVERHGEALFDVDGGGLPFNLWGSTTVRGNTMYLFLERYFAPEIVIGGLVPQVISASCLSDGRPLSYRRDGNRTILGGLPEIAPDPVLPVVKVELDGRPDQDISRVIAGADIMARFPD